MRDVEAMDAINYATYKRVKPMDLLVHKRSKFLDRATGFATIEKEVTKEGIKLYG
jgi:hypothetical protein